MTRLTLFVVLLTALLPACGEPFHAALFDPTSSAVAGQAGADDEVTALGAAGDPGAPTAGAGGAAPVGQAGSAGAPATAGAGGAWISSGGAAGGVAVAGSPSAAGAAGMAPVACPDAERVSSDAGAIHLGVEAKCFETLDHVDTVACYSWDDRAFFVNGVRGTCNQQMILTPAPDGVTTIQVLAGTSSAAEMQWFCSGTHCT